MLDALGRRGGLTVAVGPHGSATPAATLRKLGADVVVHGRMRGGRRRAGQWRRARPNARHRDPAEDGASSSTGGPQASALHRPARAALAGRVGRAPPPSPPPLRPPGPRARRRGRGLARLPLSLQLLRQDRLPRRVSPPRPRAAAGRDRRADRARASSYLYFIDEIFLPQPPAARGPRRARRSSSAIQTRIDLWKPEMLDLLGRAGCVSIEAGVESLTEDGRAALDKRCRMTTDELADRLVSPAGTCRSSRRTCSRWPTTTTALVAAWREGLKRNGVWANDPVPLYPYPVLARLPPRCWGPPDDARLGAGARALSRPVRRASATSRTSARCRSPSWRQACRTR